MKEKVKRAGILTFVFLIAVIVFSFLTNQGNADMTADMGGATLPRIQIVSGEYEINPLVGYVSEMNVGKMRSTITPVDFQSGITLRIEEGVLPIKALTYEVCSSDGKEILYKEKRKEIGEEPSLTFPGLELADREAIFKADIAYGKTGYLLLHEDLHKGRNRQRCVSCICRTIPQYDIWKRKYRVDRSLS